MRSPALVLRRRAVPLALFLIIGCKTKRESDEQRLRRYRETVCACKDMACVDAAFEILKQGDPPARAARSEEITRASQCIAKIVNGTGADTPPKPTRYHADDLLRSVRTWQQANYPQLAVWNLNVMYVEANGMLDTEHGEFTIRYGAPTNFVDDPKRKTGAPVNPEATRPTECPFLAASKDAWTRSNEYCRPAEPYVIKCMVEQIWKRAIEKGAPADALATIAFTNTEFRFWRFAIDDAPRNVHIAHDFADDCEAIVEKP